MFTVNYTVDTTTYTWWPAPSSTDVENVYNCITGGDCGSHIYELN